MRVRLRDGRVVIDTFLHRTNRYVFLATLGRVAKRDLANLSIYREINRDGSEK